jgi:hypothetical protein
MERRDAIRYTAMFLGVGLSASTVTAILHGCKVDTSDEWKPSFLSVDESDFLLALGETMLPRTSTSGAVDAMVNRFIDTVRPLRYTVDENKVFKHQLNAFIHSCTSDMGKHFLTTTAEHRLDWLQALDKSSYESLALENGALPTARPFYLQLKEQLLAAYFSSEAVAKNFFAYDPLPGRYDPCIDYASVGKMWAPI